MSSDVKSLAEKLTDVRQAVSGIAKGGHNDHHDYDYVRAEDVLRSVREAMNQARVGLFTEALDISHFTETGGKSFVTTVDLRYTLVNLDKPEEIQECYWAGAGADVGGDKGLYKAYTGGTKSFLLNLFLIPTGDDPEQDNMSEGGGSISGNVPIGAERQAAPVIPKDRATSILASAVEAGLAELPSGKPPMLKPVFIAKLADVGVDTGKIGHLNVDAAEEVEEWIAAEMSGNPDNRYAGVR